MHFLARASTVSGEIGASAPTPCRQERRRHRGRRSRPLQVSNERARRGKNQQEASCSQLRTYSVSRPRLPVRGLSRYPTHTCCVLGWVDDREPLVALICAILGFPRLTSSSCTTSIIRTVPVRGPVQSRSFQLTRYCGAAVPRESGRLASNAPCPQLGVRCPPYFPCSD